MQHFTYFPTTSPSLLISNKGLSKSVRIGPDDSLLEDEDTTVVDPMGKKNSWQIFRYQHPLTPMSCQGTCGLVWLPDKKLRRFRIRRSLTRTQDFWGIHEGNQLTAEDPVVTFRNPRSEMTESLDRGTAQKVECTTSCPRPFCWPWGICVFVCEYEWMNKIKGNIHPRLGLQRNPITTFLVREYNIYYYVS